MRTTVTLDSDVEALLRKSMKERGSSFKRAINDALRQALSGAGRRGGGSFQTATARMGVPTVNLDRALQLASELEDEELVRKMRLGK